MIYIEERHLEEIKSKLNIDVDFTEYEKKLDGLFLDVYEIGKKAMLCEILRDAKVIKTNDAFVEATRNCDIFEWWLNGSAYISESEQKMRDDFRMDIKFDK